MFANMHVKTSPALWSIISNQLVRIPFMGWDEARQPSGLFNGPQLPKFWVLLQYFPGDDSVSCHRWQDFALF